MTSQADYLDQLEANIPPITETNEPWGYVRKALECVHGILKHERADANALIRELGVHPDKRNALAQAIGEILRDAHAGGATVSERRVESWCNSIEHAKNGCPPECPAQRVQPATGDGTGEDATALDRLRQCWNTARLTQAEGVLTEFGEDGSGAWTAVESLAVAYIGMCGRQRDPGLGLVARELHWVHGKLLDATTDTALLRRTHNATEKVEAAAVLIADLKEKLAAAEADLATAKEYGLKWCDALQALAQEMAKRKAGLYGAPIGESVPVVLGLLAAAEQRAEKAEARVAATFEILRKAHVASDNRDLTIEQAFRALADALPEAFRALRPEESEAVERAGVEPKSPRVA